MNVLDAPRGHKGITTVRGFRLSDEGEPIGGANQFLVHEFLNPEI
jgi:hypothetical protein